MISMLIPPVSISRVKRGQYCCSHDQSLVIELGELLCGVLNKSVIGATSQGLNHIVVKDHGAQRCAEFMGGVQKLVNNWLILNGFTVGVQDIIVKEK